MMSQHNIMAEVAGVLVMLACNIVSVMKSTVQNLKPILVFFFFWYSEEPGACHKSFVLRDATRWLSSEAIIAIHLFLSTKHVSKIKLTKISSFKDIKGI